MIATAFVPRAAVNRPRSYSKQRSLASAVVVRLLQCAGYRALVRAKHCRDDADGHITTPHSNRKFAGFRIGYRCSHHDYVVDAKTRIRVSGCGHGFSSVVVTVVSAVAGGCRLHLVAACCKQVATFISVTDLDPVTRDIIPVCQLFRLSPPFRKYRVAADRIGFQLVNGGAA